MNLDNIKTKGVVDESKFTELSNSIAESIIDMKFISKENISALVKAQFKIFYEKQHVAKLGLKIRQLEDNITILKRKSKEHNIRMTEDREFWKSKLKENVPEDVFENYYNEIKREEKIKEKSNKHKPK